jgi:hypothetical protein
MICSTENLLGYSIIDEQRGTGPERAWRKLDLLQSYRAASVFERFESMRKIARSIRQHREFILNHFRAQFEPGAGPGCSHAAIRANSGNHAPG